MAKAEDFLRETLADAAMDAKDVLEGAEATGIAKRTLERAKVNVGVRVKPTYQEGKRGVASWVWDIPIDLDRQLSHLYDGDLKTQSYAVAEDLGRHDLHVEIGDLNNDDVEVF